MEVEGFDLIFNMIYIAKRLYDIGKYALVEENCGDFLDYDAYYENMYGLIPSLFEHYDCRYSEERGVELHVFSDPVIVDFFKLAGEFGKRNGVADKDNPHIKSAEWEVRRWLDFSYCIDWKLVGHTDPKRPFHSRLGVFIYQDDWADMGCLTYGLIEIYEWFSDACIRLKELLREEAAAA